MAPLPWAIAHASSSRASSPMSDSTSLPPTRLKLKRTPAERAERAERKARRRTDKERRRVFRANGIDDEGLRAIEEEMRDEEDRWRREGERLWVGRHGKADGRGDGFGTTPPRTKRDESLTPPRKRARRNSSIERQREEELDSLEATHGMDPGIRPGQVDTDYDESAHVSEYMSDFLARRAAARAQAEEAAFRQKLFDLMEDEEGPYDLTSGSYRSPTPPIVVPRRFQAGSTALPNPALDDEAYAESIREGMYRLKHKDEVERAERLRAAQEAKAAKVAAARVAADKEGRRRLEVIERERGRAEARRQEKEREAYVDGWLEVKRRLGAGEGEKAKHWAFSEMPWPVYRTPGTTFTPDLFTVEAITAFLDSLATAPSTVPPADAATDTSTSRRRIIRDAVLRYHPDRFERVLALVRIKDKEAVREAAGRVSRVLNEINGAGGS